jgi:hypothetical protein
MLTYVGRMLTYAEHTAVSSVRGLFLSRGLILHEVSFRQFFVAEAFSFVR